MTVTMAEVSTGDSPPIIGLSLRASSFSAMTFCFDASRCDRFGCLVILPERSFSLELVKERLPNMLQTETSDRKIASDRCKEWTG